MSLNNSESESTPKSRGISLQYEITGPRGGGTGEERTVTKGEPLPPTPQAGQLYKLVDPTKHKGSK